MIDFLSSLTVSLYCLTPQESVHIAWYIVMIAFIVVLTIVIVTLWVLLTLSNPSVTTNAESLYSCYICKLSVAENTKHCSQCNRCVDDFDHHCKFLNNDIGRVNYKMFLVIVAVYFIYTVVVIAIQFGFRRLTWVGTGIFVTV